MKASPEFAMTLEEFASAHQLPERWISLHCECEALTSNPNYWYRRTCRMQREFWLSKRPIFSMPGWQAAGWRLMVKRTV